MKTLCKYLCILALVAVGISFYACRKNANGGNTLTLLDDATVLSLSGQQYSEFISANPRITGTPAADMMRRVGTPA